MIFAGVWGLLAGVYGVPPHAAAEEVSAGVSAEEFHLPAHVPLAGYSRRRGKPARGRHDPVGARALIVQDHETTAALVSCDLLIVDERLQEAVSQRLIGRGLPSNLALVLAGTHTHSGPGAYGARFLEKLSMGHFDPRVFEALVSAITDAIVSAWGSRSPAHLVYRTGMASGLLANRIDPAGETDPELVVAAFFRPMAREPFAVAIGFSAHPTTLGSWNMELSADYPGVAVREIERRIPGSIALFFAGAVADQAPVKALGDFRSAEHIGLALAEGALALLEGAVPEAVDEVVARQELMPLPPARVRLGGFTLPTWLGRRLVDDEAMLSVVRVGPMVFLGVPCDLAVSLGGVLKQAARERKLRPMLVGFAGDYVGYCVPPAVYHSEAYEASMAFNGPQTGTLLVNRLVQMLEQVGPMGHLESDGR